MVLQKKMQSPVTRISHFDGVLFSLARRYLMAMEVSRIFRDRLIYSNLLGGNGELSVRITVPSNKLSAFLARLTTDSVDESFSKAVVQVESSSIFLPKEMKLFTAALAIFTQLTRLSLDDSLSGLWSGYASTNSNPEQIDRHFFTHVHMDRDPPVHNNPLQMRGVMLLARALPNLSKLNFLVLSNNELRREGIRVLALELPALKSLQHLGLSDNQMDFVSFRHLSRALRHMKQLKHLNISKNLPRERGLVYLARALPCLSMLLELLMRGAITYMSLSMENIEILVQSICSLNQLQNLDMSENGFSPNLVLCLSRELPKLTSLQCLRVGSLNHYLFVPAFVVAALSSESLSQLRHLDISNIAENHVDEDMFREYLDRLASAIPSLQRLESFCLYLGRHVTEDTEAVHLLRVLTMGLSHLERLDVSGPFPGCKAVLHSPALVSLELYGDGYSGEAMARSNLDGLDQLSGLSRLQCLRCTRLSEAAASRVASALPALTKLERPCLNYCHLDSDCMALLASALPSMARLLHLDLSDNSWPKDGLRLLSAGLQGTWTLQECLNHLSAHHGGQGCGASRRAWCAGCAALSPLPRFRLCPRPARRLIWRCWRWQTSCRAWAG
jgi:Ran GTPase-activating protein (RanGAP) involved in mRNA processing and transport